MILGIDASNIRGGGGVTHLVEVLRAGNPMSHGFSRVIVWSGKNTLNKIEDRAWLVKAHQPILDKSLPFRSFWQRFKLSGLARRAGCSILFVPGGSYAGDFYPMVTISQNLLPFEWRELKRYGCSWMFLKILLLRIIQTRTFSKANGVIFLTRSAQKVVSLVVGVPMKAFAIVPHGIDWRFMVPPTEALPIDRYSASRPFQILYVSIVDVYKHQWHVVEAIAKLRDEGLPVELSLLGPAYAPALRRLEKTLLKFDPNRKFCHYLGSMPHNVLETYYGNADLFVFASSCENMPNILLEAMASGLPIVCSKKDPMIEVLGDAGLYFDPENPDSIAQSIRSLIESPALRDRLARSAFKRANIYSWKRCAQETFQFLEEVVRGYNGKNRSVNG